MGVSVCRKTSIIIKKWGLGRSPKRGEGGSPTLSPFPRGRGLGIGIENKHFFEKTYFFYKLSSPCKPHGDVSHSTLRKTA